MLCGRMVKNHVQHKLHPPRFALADQLLQILHRSKLRVNLAVIRYIIAIVPLRRDKKRGQP